ncbi:MAG: YidC/Oxa1 family membrane protein insertase, partial [Saprospiraceae bacterium]
MDKNNITGLILIFMLVMAWSFFTKPSAEEIQRNQEIQDSLTNVVAEQGRMERERDQLRQDSFGAVAVISDSVKQLQRANTYGAFGASAAGEEKSYKIDNELFTVIFTNEGGRIKEVIFKKYNKLTIDSLREEQYSPLKIFDDEKNKFEFKLDVAGAAGGKINTGDLFFDGVVNGNTITFRAKAGDGAYIEQKYTVSPDDYLIDYDINLVGLQAVGNNAQSININWVNWLDRIEHNTAYEQNYTSIYYKEMGDDPDNCSCTAADNENVDGKPLKWVSHSNQFFNTTLIAKNTITRGELEIELTGENDKNLKKFTSRLEVPLDNNSVAMQFYIGPNEYNRLASYEMDLEDIIPYGQSIFGTINRWIIRPAFNFLSSFIGSAGIVIFVLTLLVKLVLYPLTYKMLYSQSKMGALKPRLAKLKEKSPDDAQAVQVETMKLYREFGVNPLGGCFPIALQMPIWFALYRFFPASIEFRQASFLWASDLSSYDVFMYLPFEIPFYGEHVSMFTILWAVTTIIYTYYNTKHMDMGVNPMMKYMQYAMPVMFLFFFNNFASGLSCYLFFSNLMNITQTIVTKEYIIDKKKIEKELEAYKKKPKK